MGEGDFKTITLDGIEYYLVPTDEFSLINNAVPETSSVPENNVVNDDDLIAGYQTESEPEIAPVVSTPEVSLPQDQVAVEVEETPEGSVTRAEGKPSEHRRKYKEHSLGPGDLMRGQGVPIDTVRKFKHNDSDVDAIHYKGDKLFFGEGLEQG